MSVPCARRQPLLMACVWPSSGSETQASRSSYDFRISTVSSVDPPSMTRYSMRGYDWPSTLSMVSRMNRPWLSEGVTTVTSGCSLMSPASDDTASRRRRPRDLGGQLGESVEAGPAAAPAGDDDRSQALQAI